MGKLEIDEKTKSDNQEEQIDGARIAKENHVVNGSRE